MNKHLIIRYLGRQPYQPCVDKMRDFTDTRTHDTHDEIWLLEHDPVYTQGQAGKAEHLLATNAIPVVQSDRGGQITYHGPGQLIAYLLLDLKRLNLGVRDFVALLEANIMAVLSEWGIEAAIKQGAPGVYVKGAKIASLGIRVRKGCSLHGFSLNVAMDLQPFLAINPCGYAGLPMTQMQTYVPNIDVSQVTTHIIDKFQQALDYRSVEQINHATK